ncbi:MAG: isoprenyl transferase [Bacillota bacterium]
MRCWRGLFTPAPPVVPRHVAVIMDGNGRWAARRGLPRLAGHRAGAESLRRVVDVCREWGVEVLSVYAFSTENWRRPRDEVQGLMLLLEEFLDQSFKELERGGVRLRLMGRLDELPRSLQSRVQDALGRTARNRGLIVNVGLSYGGRAELVRAAREVAQEAAEGKLQPAQLDEAEFSRHLYTAGLPDPDLVIRSGGEQRVSNFLLWQIAYSELWFSTVLWPDFDRRQLLRAFADYARRQRRYGGLGEGS